MTMQTHLLDLIRSIVLIYRDSLNVVKEAAQSDMV